jgi:hypothetical protein
MRKYQRLYPLLASTLLIFTYFGFLKLFAVGLQGPLAAITYAIITIFVPGYLLARAAINCTATDNSLADDWRMMVPLATLFGIGVVLICYLAAQLSGQFAANYLFLVPYLLFFARRSGQVTNSEGRFQNLAVTTLVTVIFVFAITYFILMERSTPGLVVLDLFHDHLWNVGNTVALVYDFPLYSLNIETRPAVPYHILVHIIGAHMTLLTGLVPHLVGLQYVFIPLAIILVLNVVAFLNLVLGQRVRYLVYGATIIFFGSGFALVHEVKVQSYLVSPTNFLGIIVLFTWFAIQARAERLSTFLRWFCAFLVLFLATGAKGSIGAALVGGAILLLLHRLWKNEAKAGDLTECAGALVGFATSYLIFFVLPTVLSGNVQVPSDTISNNSLPIAPFIYITQSALASNLVYYIDSYLDGTLAMIARSILTVVLLPIHILLYYSFRLLPFLDRQRQFGDLEQRLIWIAASSILIAYTVKGTAQDHAYFLTAGLLSLDILFILWISRISLLNKLQTYLNKRHLFACLGALLVIVLPFASVPGWFKPAYIMNIFAYGHIGQTFDEQLSNSSYRKEHTTITPDLYHALQYIRQHTPLSTIVVTPFIKIQNGKAVSFWTSAFAERAAYLEGYDFVVKKVVAKVEIKERERIVSELYNSYIIPQSLLLDKYVIIANEEFIADIKTRWDQQQYEILSETGEWFVLRLIEI